MFDHPLFLPTALGIIVFGLLYLFISRRRELEDAEKKTDTQPHGWHVQCPKCNRWKQMQPLRRELLEEQKISILPGTQHRYIHEYKCAFCGHKWQERYTG